jgi:hypothetical protein
MGSCIGPFANCGLDEALGLTVGSDRCRRPGKSLSGSTIHYPSSHSCGRYAEFAGDLLARVTLLAQSLDCIAGRLGSLAFR